MIGLPLARQLLPLSIRGDVASLSFICRCTTANAAQYLVRVFPTVFFRNPLRANSISRAIKSI